MKLRNPFRKSKKPGPPSAAKIASILRAKFDTDFYHSVYPDVKEGAVDPVKHYVLFGWKEGRDPSPHFSTRFYLESNPDVRNARINPYYHYIKWGRHEGRRPLAVAATDRSPDPRPPDPMPSELKREFDESFYRCRYPNTCKSDLSPVEHYIAYGWKEGRDPCADFSTSYYLTANPDVRDAGINPFYHYLTTGRKEGRLGQPPGGFRARALEKLITLEQKVQNWRRPDSSSIAALTPELIVRSITNHVGPDPGDIVVSLSHDDYTQSVGGVQLCIQLEERAVMARGATYLNLNPSQPLPVLATKSEFSSLPVNMICNGKAIGVASYSDITAALSVLVGQSNQLHLVVHALHGNSPEAITELYSTLPFKNAYFWMHDYFAICPGYNLLRNEVSFCGAPPLESSACSICIFGESRTQHVPRLKRLFDSVPFVVIAPSESALDIWQQHAGLSRRTLVHEHCTIKSSGCGPQQNEQLVPGSASIRVGFLGHQFLHKGWPVFLELSHKLMNEKGFEFCHLGTRHEPTYGMSFTPVTVSNSSPTAMSDAIRQAGIDVALIWSIWPETFCYTAYEALAGGAAIVTNEGSGNVVRMVRTRDCGLVFSSEEDLMRAFTSGQVRSYVVNRRRQKGKDRYPVLQYSSMTANLLDLKR